MKYIINVEGMLHAYTRPALLKMHIISNEPKEYTIYRELKTFTESYEPITLEQLTEDINVQIRDTLKERGSK